MKVQTNDITGFGFNVGQVINDIHCIDEGQFVIFTTEMLHFEGQRSKMIDVNFTP